MIRRWLYPSGGYRLYMQSALLLVALFVVVKAAIHLVSRHAWQMSERSDLATLLVLAIVVCAVTAVLLARGPCDRESRLRESIARRENENEAAARVVRVIINELAQPLSGALGYSEMLMMRAGQFGGRDRTELEGLREGVLQMEHLLQNLRSTVDDIDARDHDRRLVDDLELCIGAPRARLHVRGTMAAVPGEAPARP